MAKGRGTAIAVFALSIYVIGGLSVFAGLACFGFWRHDQILGLGNGTSIGLLLICVGLCCTILGVLVMRICRNRGLY